VTFCPQFCDDLSFNTFVGKHVYGVGSGIG
jgi:hypothetical protein